MSSNAIQVFVAAYQSEDAAGAAFKDFRALDREGSIELIDAAVTVHTAEGKVKIEETADPSGKKWGKRGAIAGGLAGLIFPPSIIAGALVGGAGGGVWGKVRDKGFKDEDLKAIGESLPPGKLGDHRHRRGPGGRAAAARPRGLRTDRAPRPQRRRCRRDRGRTRRHPRAPKPTPKES